MLIACSKEIVQTCFPVLTVDQTSPLEIVVKNLCLRHLRQCLPIVAEYVRRVAKLNAFQDENMALWKGEDDVAVEPSLANGDEFRFMRVDCLKAVSNDWLVALWLTVYD